MHRTALIHEFLHDARVPYSVVPHEPAYSAQEEAAAVHVPGRDWAKVVVCFVDDRPVQAVVPAPMNVDLELLLQLARGELVRLAHESELRRLFPECEEGRCRRSGRFMGRRCMST